MLAEPSTVRALDEPPAGRLTIQYAPVAETEITETPPRFTWIPALEDEAVYALSVVAEGGSERVYVAPIWRQTYIDCQELIYAIRHQAIAGRILPDADLTKNAKAWLLEAATWDPDGTTSRSYTDEWAFRVNLALAWGYDWLYDALSEDERTLVRRALLARTRQVAEHCIENARIQLFPFDSHAVRSVSAVLVPACLAMLGEEPEAEEWLNYSVEFLFTVYSPWGDSDGGWAEGPHYWMTGMAYQWYFDEICRNDPGTEKAFYNWGWWDLTFDDLVFTHDFGTVPSAPPTERLKWFKGIGWAAIQSKMGDPDGHIQFVMKSSPWGSISHSHGDQNAFCLAGFGEDLAIQSGHYVAFNSSMHQNWRRQTISKNAILPNGKGQYAGKDKAAYQSLTPEVTRVLRDVYFVHDSYFVIVDQVDASAPLTLEWLYHANAPMDLGASTFRYSGQRAGLYGKVLWSEAGAPEITQTIGFPGVDLADYEGLDQSTHISAAFPPARSHRITTRLVPHIPRAPRAASSTSSTIKATTATCTSQMQTIGPFGLSSLKLCKLNRNCHVACNE